MRKPLTEPRAGWSFCIKKLLVHFNIAKSWTWSDDIEKYDIRRTYMVSIHLAEKNNKTAIVFILGPFKLSLGIFD